MPENSEQIARLQARLDKMVEYQDYFFREINLIRVEIAKLGANPNEPNYAAPSAPSKNPSVKEDVSFYKPTERKQQLANETVPPNSNAASTTAKPFSQTESRERKQSLNPNLYVAAPQVRHDKSDLEKFIGENLISKIGIVITVIGVGIGAKYAIDHELISPLTRIVLGYLFGIALLGFAIRLKEKYLNFSSVLLGGAMAIMYFLTFAAYGYYGLISQTAAFLLMVFFTVFTVLAAINYNRQFIAHLGLVGAYAVPFLLSNDSGNVRVLFGYMTVINLGILAVSVKKYWKPLFYTSFVLTWTIFAAWYFGEYKQDEHFTLSLFFATVFFLTFYLTFLAYKLISREKFAVENVVLLLANSFIFYGLGYSILQTREDWRQFSGIFTILTAFVHFVVGLAIYKYTSAEKSVINLVVGLVVVFITLAVPVQLNGNWVTLSWTAEAAILFWLGRTKNIPLYEQFSYPLMLVAALSLLQDWQIFYENFYARRSEFAVAPLFNSNFLTAILFAAAFGFIHFINRNRKFQPAIGEPLYKITTFAIPAILFVALYNAFRMEIGNYFHYQTIKTAVAFAAPPDNFDYATSQTDTSLDYFNVIWQINYTMLFLTALSFLNIWKIKSFALGAINLALNLLLVLTFLAAGLYVLGELRDSYLLQTNADLFNRGWFHLAVRYVSYAFLAALFTATYKYIKQSFLSEKLPESNLKQAFDFVFFTSLLWILSSELVNWTDVYNLKNSYKLGLSILWGIYALFLIVLGINKNKKHLRVGAIALFALTLIKLFLYDIADLDTISKTVVFLILGVLLLIISFLYNKYKHLIFDESQKS